MFKYIKSLFETKNIEDEKKEIKFSKYESLSHNELIQMLGEIANELLKRTLKN